MDVCVHVCICAYNYCVYVIIIDFYMFVLVCVWCVYVLNCMINYMFVCVCCLHVFV